MKTRLVAVLVALVALVVGLLAPPARAAAPPDPAEDPFFVAPRNLAELAPGTVIRSRPASTFFASAGGFGLPIPAHSRQVLVRSTDSKGRPAAVSAMVMAPLVGAKHHLLAYAPATDSLGAKCDTSYLLQDGVEKEAAIMALALANGITVVAVDHQGPRHAYGAGRMAGHAMLDASRGALSLPSSKLAGPATKVAMVGYSGGAIAAGWAAELKASYAPELNVVGVASGGTPGDMRATGKQMDGGILGGLLVAASIGMSREYPELLSIFNARGLAHAEKIKDACASDLILRPFDRVTRYSDSPDPLGEPVALRVLADNKLGSTPPPMPYYLWQSRWDEAIPWASVKTLHRDWCGRGARVQMVTDYTSEHITGAALMIPTALPWLLDRYAGRPFRDNCP